MLSVYFNEMPSVFILPAYIKLLKQQKALKNQPFFKAFSRSFFTANSMVPSAGISTNREGKKKQIGKPPRPAFPLLLHMLLKIFPS